MSRRDGRREIRSSSSEVELRLYSRVGVDEEVVSSADSLVLTAVGRERRVEAIVRFEGGNCGFVTHKISDYMLSSNDFLMMRGFHI